MIEAILRLAVTRRRTDDRLRRIRLRAVPIPVEDGRELIDHLADKQDVHVHEIAGDTPGKILVGDVAPSHHGERAVRNEQLVVHPVVQTPDVAKRCGKSARDALPGAAKRIEEPHLDVGKRRQAAEHRVGARRVEVVDQQAHPHAP